MSEDRVYARVRFTYDKLELERGEVFELIGARNDDALMRGRYCVELKKSMKVRKCDDCGKEFADFAYSGHRSGNHAQKPITEKDFAPLFQKTSEEV